MGTMRLYDKRKTVTGQIQIRTAVFDPSCPELRPQDVGSDELEAVFDSQAHRGPGHEAPPRAVHREADDGSGRGPGARPGGGALADRTNPH
jgi:hypothetical protein